MPYDVQTRKGRFAFSGYTSNQGVHKVCNASRDLARRNLIFHSGFHFFVYVLDGVFYRAEAPLGFPKVQHAPVAPRSHNRIPGLSEKRKTP